MRMNQPCNECPFRRCHPAGWLGGYEAQHFIDQVVYEGPVLDCHKTMEEGVQNQPCYGAMIFMKNSCKMPRDPVYAEVVAEVTSDTKSVFHFAHEFLAHHEGGKPDENFDHTVV